MESVGSPHRPHPGRKPKLRQLAPFIMLMSGLAAHVAVSGERPTDAYSAGNDWAYYNGNPSGTHFSHLDRINRTNVRQLGVAWTYDTQEGVLEDGDMESNPLVVKGKLYFASPTGRLICLDGASGKELWTYDPIDANSTHTHERKRGLAYWTDGRLRRILFTFRSDLLSVDADTGRPDSSFGKEGRVDLRDGLDRDPATLSVFFSSPGTVYKDLIVIGSTGFTPGHIRAFDVRTGRLIWTFHTIPYPTEYGYETWPPDAWKTAMGANCWSGFSLDQDRGIVFASTASAGMSFKDFYGADRIGDNLFANSILALDANTGRRLWHFQVVKHDLWDWDLPSAPTLVTIRRSGKQIDAIAQITKSGYVFILDRSTGRPLFPIAHRPALPSDVPGEVAAPTQLVPVIPKPFARQRLTAEMLDHGPLESTVQVAKALAEVRSAGVFAPPSLQGTIEFPGTEGGGQWGGAAFDPETGLLFINSNEMPWILRLRKNEPVSGDTGGRTTYLTYCSQCHRNDLKGSPPQVPSLINMGGRLSGKDLATKISSGGGRMPGFPGLSGVQLDALITYISSPGTALAPTDEPEKEAEHNTRPDSSNETYVFDGYKRFVDSNGYPAISPPWGTLNAIDLSSGRYAWRIPFGSYPELASKGLKNTGSENYGGGLVTAGGLLFIGATAYDRQFHAFDKRTGKLLWTATLPAAGNATPATYIVQGKQFVVIAAGGGKDARTPSGGVIIAFCIRE